MNTLSTVHSEDILEKLKKLKQGEKLVMQNITCHSNGYHVSYNFKNAVSIKVAIVMTFFGRVWWWSSIFCVYMHLDMSQVH